jgi:hypothetical protein
LLTDGLKTTFGRFIEICDGLFREGVSQQGDTLFPQLRSWVGGGHAERAFPLLEFFRVNIHCVPGFCGVQGATGKRPKESASGYPLQRMDSKLAG